MIKIFTETLFQTVSQYSALRLNKSQLMHRYFNWLLFYFNQGSEFISAKLI